MLDLLPPLDRQSDHPFYRQIAAALAGEIEAGSLPPGARLAPVRRVAAALGVNFNTVARAYRELDGRGLVVMRQGRGTFVREHEGAEAAPALAEVVNAFLRRTSRLGYSAQEVRWEVASGIRAWMQAGHPPGS